MEQTESQRNLAIPRPAGYDRGHPVQAHAVATMVACGQEAARFDFGEGIQNAHVVLAPPGPWNLTRLKATAPVPR
jgi:hypothetical protein